MKAERFHDGRQLGAVGGAGARRIDGIDEQPLSIDVQDPQYVDLARNLLEPLAFPVAQPADEGAEPLVPLRVAPLEFGVPCHHPIGPKLSAQLRVIWGAGSENTPPDRG